MLSVFFLPFPASEGILIELTTAQVPKARTNFSFFFFFFFLSANRGIDVMGQVPQGTQMTHGHVPAKLQDEN